MHPVDEMRNLHDSLQAFELRTLKRLAPWLATHQQARDLSWSAGASMA